MVSSVVSSAMNSDVSSASSAVIFLHLGSLVHLRGTAPTPLTAELLRMTTSGMVELWTASVISGNS